MNYQLPITNYQLPFRIDMAKTVIGLVFSLLLFTNAVQAQSVRASQKATVSQFVADTEIMIEYSRPVARGRTLFGNKGIVKYNKIWMPGANEASTIKFSSDVLINGKSLKAGKYSFWVIPNEKSWLIILSKDWDQWHTKYPGTKDDALRFEVAPEEGSHMEVMAFYFPVVTKNSTMLHLHWGKTIIPMEIKLVG
jgi:hypothetical protein